MYLHIRTFLWKILDIGMLFTRLLFQNLKEIAHEVLITEDTMLQGFQMEFQRCHLMHRLGTEDSVDLPIIGGDLCQ